MKSSKKDLKFNLALDNINNHYIISTERAYTNEKDPNFEDNYQSIDISPSNDK